MDFEEGLGVFRISGSVDQETRLEQELAVDDYSRMNVYQPEVVSTVFKKVFDNMKYPLFPYHLYNYIKGTRDNIPEEELK